MHARLRIQRQLLVRLAGHATQVSQFLQVRAATGLTFWKLRAESAGAK